jgi:hypothetical protein
MTRRILGGRILGCVVFCGLMAAVSLQAHHSLAATYDIRKEGQLTGVVTKVAFKNPHGAMHVAVKGPDGTLVEWIFTTGSANALQGLGFDSKVVKAGDEVTINYYESRTGKPLGFMRGITLGNKRQFEFEAN